MIQTISIKEIVHLIITDKVNFIATAITPWHAIGVDACVLKLIDDGIDVSGIILIEMHTLGGYVIDKSHFTNSQCSVYFVEKPLFDGVFVELKLMIQKFYSIFKLIRNEKTGPQIYLASSWHINAGLFVKLNKHLINHNFSFIVFEEGLATYFPSSESCITIWRDSGINKTLIKHIFSFIFRILNKYINSLLEKIISFENFNLFDQKGKTLIKNNNALKYYGLTLKVVHQSIKYSKVFENSTIICTMPYPRNEMNIKEYVFLLKEVIDCLVRKGAKVVLKPHPRELDYKEMYSSLNCVLFDKRDLSLESIMASYTIESIIGFSSTSLITSSLLFDIKSISLLGLQESSNFGKKIGGEMKDFEDIFSDFVSMPNSMLELKEIL